jgi:ABC-type nitrate/sulfonate/bicarbonate transport system ATPase subunit
MMPQSGNSKYLRDDVPEPGTAVDQKPPMPATLAVDRVCKVFPSRAGGPPLEALRSVSFTAERGEFISLIGPSGCGKTTLLRIVHGLEAATEGSVSFEGQTVSAPDQTRAVIFQGFNLFPWRTVAQNIAFGLEVRGDDADSLAQRVDEMIRLVGLGGFEHHYPHEISGGMQQRVGIARALALDPSVLLMDEPFGALDAITREKLQRDLAAILARQPKTILFITHNMDEAIFFSDRILVFGTRPGRIIEEVKVPFARPRTVDVVRASRQFAELREHLWSLLSQELAA